MSNANKNSREGSRADPETGLPIETIRGSDYVPSVQGSRAVSRTESKIQLPIATIRGSDYVLSMDETSSQRPSSVISERPMLEEPRSNRRKTPTVIATPFGEVFKQGSTSYFRRKPSGQLSKPREERPPTESPRRKKNVIATPFGDVVQKGGQQYLRRTKTVAEPSENPFKRLIDAGDVPRSNNPFERLPVSPNGPRRDGKSRSHQRSHDNRRNRAPIAEETDETDEDPATLVEELSARGARGGAISRSERARLIEKGYLSD